MVDFCAAEYTTTTCDDITGCVADATISALGAHVCDDITGCVADAERCPRADGARTTVTQKQKVAL